MDYGEAAASLAVVAAVAVAAVVAVVAFLVEDFLVVVKAAAAAEVKEAVDSPGVVGPTLFASLA